jgi:hypothetical protein
MCFFVASLNAASAAVLNLFRLSETTPKFFGPTHSVMRTLSQDSNIEFMMTSTLEHPHATLRFSAISPDAAHPVIPSLEWLSETTPKIYWATRSIVWTPTPDYITYHNSAYVLSKMSDTSASPCACIGTLLAPRWTRVHCGAHDIFLCSHPLHSMQLLILTHSLIHHLHPYKSESAFPTRLGIPLLYVLPVSHGLCFYLCHLLFLLETVSRNPTLCPPAPSGPPLYSASFRLHSDLRSISHLLTPFGPPLLSAPDSVQTSTPIHVMSDVRIQTAMSSFLDTGCPHRLSSGVTDPSGPLFFPLCTKCLCPVPRLFLTKFILSPLPSMFTCISMRCQSISLPPPSRPLRSLLLLPNLVPMSFSVAGPH